MINIIARYKKDKVEKVELTGHANYKEFGKDIVCASVSSIVYATLYYLLELKKPRICYTDNNEIIEFTNCSFDRLTNTLMQGMIDIFLQLEEQYPDNISIRIIK